MIKAVILDLDQTLTSDTGSWYQFTNLLGADQKVHADIFEKFKLGKLSYKKAKNDLIELWKTTGKTNLKDIGTIFSQIELRPHAIEAVNYISGKYEVCLISGAIDIFVEIFANRLNINSYYASTKFIFDKNDELVDFNYKLSRGEEKLKYFDDFCAKNKLKSMECAAIGDGDSDMPIFSKVGLPILFLASETSEEQRKKIKIQMRDWKEIYNII